MLVYFSVDVEASGPLPGFFDLLSVGAVVVREGPLGLVRAREEFAIELKPVHGAADPDAMRVNRLDLARLHREGLAFDAAARAFDAFVRGQTAPGEEAVFVGYCANFDWAYVNDLFHRAGVRNPFGYKALDLRSLALGLLAGGWQEMRQEAILPQLGLAPLAPELAHDALEDARHQAEMLIRLLERSASARAGNQGSE